MGVAITIVKWTAVGFGVAFGALIINRGVEYGREEEAKKYDTEK